MAFIMIPEKTSGDITEGVGMHGGYTKVCITGTWVCIPDEGRSALGSVKSPSNLFNSCPEPLPVGLDASLRKAAAKEEELD